MKNAVLLVVILLIAVLPLPGSADEASEELRRNYLALDLMLEGQARVMRVADRIRIAGAKLCGKKISQAARVKRVVQPGRAYLNAASRLRASST